MRPVLAPLRFGRSSAPRLHYDRHMSIFSIWPSFGFRSNPYSQDTLSPDDLGDSLLVGRDAEVATISALIGTDGAFPTIEGPIGVGKSSLLEVTGYRMRKLCLAAKAGELYLPAVSRLQPSANLDELEAEAYRIIAQTLIRYADDFEKAGLFRPNVDELDKWLNASRYFSWEGGAGGFGFSANAGGGEEGNTGEGYTKSGFPSAIRALLQSAFAGQRGGIIVILDNLELVETVGAARAALDYLRDRIFNLPHVRWVLSGSRGIVSRARTERLSGIFQAPLRLDPLRDATTIDAINRRIDVFGSEDAVAPVTPTGFAFLYGALNSNLRESLSTSQEFAHWLHQSYVAQSLPLPTEQDRDALLEAWLLERATSAYQDASRVQPRNWRFFSDLCAAGGRANASEWEKFEFTTQQQYGSAVTQLADANLVVRETDPEDATRKVYAVTPLGRLVYFFRKNFVSIATTG